MQTRINGRFKGLLEVNQAKTSTTPTTTSIGPCIDRESKVDFLHRTVKDFLFTSECQQLLSSWAPSSFDVNYSLSQVYLADLKELLGNAWASSRKSSAKQLADSIFCSLSNSEEKGPKFLEPAYQEFYRILKPSFDIPRIDSMLLWQLVAKRAIPSFLHWIISLNDFGTLNAALPDLTQSLTVDKKRSYLETAVEVKAFHAIEYLTAAKPHLKFSVCEISSFPSLDCDARPFRDHLLAVLRVMCRCGAIERNFTASDKVALNERYFSTALITELLELIPREDLQGETCEPTVSTVSRLDLTNGRPSKRVRFD